MAIAQFQIFGIGVTILNGAEPVSPSNPLPVTPGGLAPAPFGSAVQQEAVATLVNGNNTIVAASPGNSVYVTGYTFGLTLPTAPFFTSNAGGLQISAAPPGIIGAAEVCGAPEYYLFKTSVGQALVFNNPAGGAGSMQLRYRLAP